MSSVTVDNNSVNISITTRIIVSSSDPIPDDNSSSNINITISISAICSDSIDVSSANVNDRPWGKRKGKVNSVANGKGKCKVTNDGFSVKRKNGDASNVSKPDNGCCR
ncbi:hypothetical protein Tco_0328798 [Tanacetum coccineum]